MSKANLMVLHRDYVLSTKTGHRISFKKGEPTHVPPIVYNEAIAIGAVNADGSDANVITDTKIPKQFSPEEREKSIRGAIESITLRNEISDFSAGGRPHPKAVSKLVGVNVGQKEIDTILTKMADEKELGK